MNWFQFTSEFFNINKQRPEQTRMRRGRTVKRCVQNSVPLAMAVQRGVTICTLIYLSESIKSDFNEQIYIFTSIILITMGEGENYLKLLKIKVI